MSLVIIIIINFNMKQMNSTTGYQTLTGFVLELNSPRYPITYMLCPKKGLSYEKIYANERVIKKIFLF